MSNNRNSAAGISDFAVVSEVNETPEEKALLGMGAQRMDGNVTVPGMSTVFSRNNSLYRAKIAATGDNTNDSGSAEANRVPRRAAQAPGGPVSALNTALRAGGSTTQSQSQPQPQRAAAAAGVGGGGGRT